MLQFLKEKRKGLHCALIFEEEKDDIIALRGHDSIHDDMNMSAMIT